MSAGGGKGGGDRKGYSYEKTMFNMILILI